MSMIIPGLLEDMGPVAARLLLNWIAPQWIESTIHATLFDPIYKLVLEPEQVAHAKECLKYLTAVNSLHDDTANDNVMLLPSLSGGEADDDTGTMGPPC